MAALAALAHFPADVLYHIFIWPFFLSFLLLRRILEQFYASRSVRGCLCCIPLPTFHACTLFWRTCGPRSPCAHHSLATYSISWRTCSILGSYTMLPLPPTAFSSAIWRCRINDAGATSLAALMSCLRLRGSHTPTPGDRGTAATTIGNSMLLNILLAQYTEHNPFNLPGLSNIVAACLDCPQYYHTHRCHAILPGGWRVSGSLIRRYLVPFRPYPFALRC